MGVISPMSPRRTTGPGRTQNPGLERVSGRRRRDTEHRNRPENVLSQTWTGSLSPEMVGPCNRMVQEFPGEGSTSPKSSTKGGGTEDREFHLPPRPEGNTGRCHRRRRRARGGVPFTGGTPAETCGPYVHGGALHVWRHQETEWV